MIRLIGHKEVAVALLVVFGILGLQGLTVAYAVWLWLAIFYIWSG